MIDPADVSAGSIVIAADVGERLELAEPQALFAKHG
jgi:hypothetical protein